MRTLVVSDIHGNRPALSAVTAAPQGVPRLERAGYTVERAVEGLRAWKVQPAAVTALAAILHAGRPPEPAPAHA